MKHELQVANRWNPFRRGPRMDLKAAPWVAVNTTSLRELVERLERDAEDLRDRAARRAELLDTPDGAPRSDPIYQRLYFALQVSLRELGQARTELGRRTGARTAEQQPRTKLRIHADSSIDAGRRELPQPSGIERRAGT